MEIFSSFSRFKLLFVFCVWITVLHQSSAGPKDLNGITFARPKHLRYASYKQEKSDSSSEEHLSEAKNIDKPHTNGSRIPANINLATSGSNNLKRSLISDKSARLGGPIGVQKTPPDLQFGLAFTVPFVSLSTDKLINTIAGKSSGWGSQDVSNILKLNLGGLLAAVIVGIGALILVPGILHPGKLGGWGGLPGVSLLDGILPHGVLPGFIDHFLGGIPGHGFPFPGSGDGWSSSADAGSRPFGFQDFYEYNGVHNHNRKDTASVLKTSRREGRKTPGNSTTLISELMRGVGSYALNYAKTAEKCLQLQVCRKASEINAEKQGKAKSEDESSLVDLIESFSENDLLKESRMSKGIQKARQHGMKYKQCKKYEKPECNKN